MANTATARTRWPACERPEGVGRAINNTVKPTIKAVRIIARRISIPAGFSVHGPLFVMGLPDCSIASAAKFCGLVVTDTPEHYNRVTIPITIWQWFNQSRFVAKLFQCLIIF
jgi:hypothetical protein